VRLKGGDAGIFGRLAEEVEALEKLGLASRVLPGISAMQTAAADTGMLLTRRGVARGFSAMTPRLQGGGLAPVDEAARAALPVVFYMSVGVAPDLAVQLQEDGLSGETPCAFVFDAGSDREALFHGTLNQLPDVDPDIRKRPGLFMVGEISRYRFDHSLGALQGQRVLLTCSEALMDRAVQAVHDFGGRPVVRPLIRLEPVKEVASIFETLDDFDWIALTSPSSVRCFHELLLKETVDLRRLPKMMSVGSGTARALEKIGLGCDLMPTHDFSAQGLLEAAALDVCGKRILRLRSQKAGPNLADGLRAAGAEVEDCILYENRFIEYERAPEFDSVFFASASAVESFIAQWGADALAEKTILSIGVPTRTALKSVGLDATVVASMARVEKSVAELAVFEINRRVNHVS
jgi:uroporphyrinogen III methyltransferase/synthase